MTSLEVKRTNWGRFVKRLNAMYQYRPVSVTVKAARRTEQPVVDNCPFLGLSLTRIGRKIDGLELYTGWWDPDRLNRPSVAVRQPAKINQTAGPDGGIVGLTIESEDGAVVNLSFGGEPIPHEAVVEKLAYALYERRGANDGADVADWLEAELVVRQVVEPLVS